MKGICAFVCTGSACFSFQIFGGDIFMIDCADQRQSVIIGCYHILHTHYPHAVMIVSGRYVADKCEVKRAVIVKERACVDCAENLVLDAEVIGYVDCRVLVRQDLTVEVAFQPCCRIGGFLSIVHVVDSQIRIIVFAFHDAERSDRCVRLHDAEIECIVKIVLAVAVLLILGNLAIVFVGQRIKIHIILFGLFVINDFGCPCVRFNP